MVDATTGHEVLSFMDGSSGYNQIRMLGSHLDDLRVVFDRLRKYNLKMNPLKCAFGVTSEKFLGFIVRYRGIEVDPSKIDAIQRMPAPRNLKELRSLQGNLAFIRRFISNLAGRCQPFNHLMKKDTPFTWDKKCENVFESIKRYLTNPPVLRAPMHGKPLILYIAAQEKSVGALMAQENEERKERALYYLSRTLTENELKYSPVEKICLALFYAIKKLKHYFEAYSIQLISRADPVKYVMSRPMISGRLAKWSIIFNQYEITYVPQKAVKGQALADFLADHPTPTEWELSDEFPDEDVLFIEVLPTWTMFFYGAARSDGAGAGVVFVSPEKQVLTYSIVLGELCSNNVTEYQALIIGLQMVQEMDIMELEVFGDSSLVINQHLNLYEVRKDNLVPYFREASNLLNKFLDIALHHDPRKENRLADTLANLATTLALLEGETTNVSVCNRWVVPSLAEVNQEDANTISVSVSDDGDWRTPLVDYLKEGKLPQDPRHRADVRRRSSRFILYKDTLYQRSFEGNYQRCLNGREAVEAMSEAHSGIYGARQSGPKLHFQIKRMGYYWPTMVKDCLDYAKRCEACQLHANFIHQPPEPLHPTVASWPFD
ncbi:DNA-directed DNA polymerase, partial [Handroanthus impetiginosus]